MKIALIGYGKMGRTIDRMAVSMGHDVVGRIDVETKNKMTDVLAEADVAIEFSHPDAAYDNILACLKADVPVVCGTTGWTDRLEEIARWVKRLDGGFVYASNFSVGVNLFFALNTYFSKLMSSYEVYRPVITETHHIQKKDAPSGTAITLAQEIIEHSGFDQWHLGSDATNTHSIPIEAIRRDDVFGIHRIEYTSEIDTLSIEHSAHTREGFAHGALMAASFLIGKKGIFTMAEVLGIDKRSAP